MKLDDGQVVKLVERRGRWLRVQVRSKQGWIPRSYVEEDLRDEEEIVAARENVQDTRGRRSKTNVRRGDKGFDTLDEDARGEDGVSEMVDEDEEADDESDRKDKKQAKKKKAMKDEEDDEEASDDEDEGDEDDEGDDGEEPRAKKKSKKEKKVAKAGIREGSTVALKAKTPVRMKPSKKSDALFEASKGEEVEVIMINEDDPEYVRIQTEDGSKGWVPKKALAMAGGGGGGGDEDEDDDADDDENPIDDEEGEDEEGEDGETSVTKGGSFFSGMDIGVMASVGLISKSQNFVSSGTDPVKSNYKLGNNAPVIILGGGVSKPFGQYTAGVEAAYVRSIGGKGITIKDPTGTMDNEQVAWVTQQIDLRVVGGYWLSEGKYLVGGGLGYHIGQVAMSANTIADLPGERVAGIRIGGEFRAPKMTEKIGVRAALDALLGASMVQQPGITDGTSSKVTAYYVSLGGTYALKPHWAVQAGYGMAYERFNFSGESDRNGPSVTSGRRKDLQHTIGAGVGYEF